jgi:NTP pyrophosphatase (non-canonical NTP hydrolase)|tara:strand:- start:25525 stop:25779 length:255 start_codon:yes stop_codon:yes gene_type:complete
MPSFCLGQWSNATLGELGEAANIIKKIERGDFTLEEARPALAKEFADVAIYLDLLSWQAGVNLGEAVRSKFNEVSERIEADVRI